MLTQPPPLLGLRGTLGLSPEAPCAHPERIPKIRDREEMLSPGPCGGLCVQISCPAFLPGLGPAPGSVPKAARMGLMHPRNFGRAGLGWAGLT